MKLGKGCKGVYLLYWSLIVFLIVPSCFGCEVQEQSGDWGTLLNDVTSEGFTSDYNGYKFKVDDFVYTGSEITGVVLDIQKPDGSVVIRTPKTGLDATVDRIGVRYMDNADSSPSLYSVDLYVYDLDKVTSPGLYGRAVEVTGYDSGGCPTRLSFDVLNTRLETAEDVEAFLYSDDNQVNVTDHHESYGTIGGGQSESSGNFDVKVCDDYSYLGFHSRIEGSYDGNYYCTTYNFDIPSDCVPSCANEINFALEGYNIETRDSNSRPDTFSVNLKNTGWIRACNVKARLSAVSSGITIERNEITDNFISAGSYFYSPDDFDVRVDTSSSPLQFRLSVSWDDCYGHAGSKSIDFNVPIESCSDGVKNLDETDVDCGGVCDPCGLGKVCSGKDSNCMGGLYCDTGNKCNLSQIYLTQSVYFYHPTKKLNVIVDAFDGVKGKVTTGTGSYRVLNNASNIVKNGSLTYGNGQWGVSVNLSSYDLKPGNYRVDVEIKSGSSKGLSTATFNFPVGYGEISGIAESLNGPMSGVLISLYNANNYSSNPTAAVPIINRTTDSYGLYVFHNITPGTYIVKGSKPGYHEYVGSSFEVTGTGNTYTKNMLLIINTDASLSMLNPEMAELYEETYQVLDDGTKRLASISERAKNDLFQDYTAKDLLRFVLEVPFSRGGFAKYSKAVAKQFPKRLSGESYTTAMRHVLEATVKRKARDTMSVKDSDAYKEILEIWLGAVGEAATMSYDELVNSRPFTYTNGELSNMSEDFKRESPGILVHQDFDKTKGERIIRSQRDQLGLLHNNRSLTLIPADPDMDPLFFGLRNVENLYSVSAFYLKLFGEGEKYTSFISVTTGGYAVGFTLASASVALAPYTVPAAGISGTVSLWSGSANTLFSFFELGSVLNTVSIYSLSHFSWAGDNRDVPMIYYSASEFLKKEAANPYYLNKNNNFDLDVAIDMRPDAEIAGRKIVYSKRVNDVFHLPVSVSFAQKEADITVSNRGNVPSTIRVVGESSRGYASLIIPSTVSSVSYFNRTNLPAGNSVQGNMRYMDFFDPVFYLDERVFLVRAFSGPFMVKMVEEYYYPLDLKSIQQLNLLNIPLSAMSDGEKASVQTLHTASTSSGALSVEDFVGLTASKKLIFDGLLSSANDTVELNYTVPQSAYSVEFHMFSSPEENVDLHVYDSGGNHVGYDLMQGGVVMGFPAAYTGESSVPEIIDIRSATNKTYRIKTVLRRSDSNALIPVRIYAFETPFRPAVLAFSPSEIYEPAISNQNVTVSVILGEAGHQHPVNGTIVSISDLRNKEGVGLQRVGANTQYVGVLPAASRKTASFDLFVPGNVPLGNYTGVVNISSDNAGSLSLNVTVYVVSRLNASVTLSSNSTSFYVGETARVTAVVKDINNNRLNGTFVMFSSSNDSVISLSEEDSVVFTDSTGAASINLKGLSLGVLNITAMEPAGSVTYTTLNIVQTSPPSTTSTTITSTTTTIPDNPPSLSLSVDPSTAYVGQQIEVTVSAVDDFGVNMILANYNSNWEWHSCGGAASCSYTWYTSQSSPGVYIYYGYVYDTKNQFDPQWNTTKKKTITVLTTTSTTTTRTTTTTSISTTTSSTSTTSSTTTTVAYSPVKCWNSSAYISYSLTNNLRKFCKCAFGSYGYSAVSLMSANKNTQEYTDLSNNTNWATHVNSNDYGVVNVTCLNGLVYRSDKDYYSVCVLKGNYQPCDVVTLSEVVAYITLWSTGKASMSDVVSLITAWSNPSQSQSYGISFAPGVNVEVVRDLPSYAVQGQTYTVYLNMNVDESNKPNAVGLTEYYPPGWQVSEISYGGINSNGKIEWLFWVYGNPVQDTSVTYKILVPSGSSGTYAFTGNADIGTSVYSISGDTTVIVSTTTTSITTSTSTTTTSTTSTTIPPCYDSDGSNYFIKGYVDYGTLRTYDHCLEENKPPLFEEICRGGRSEEIVNCPGVCSDGKCVTTTSTTITTSTTTTSTTTVTTTTTTSTSTTVSPRCLISASTCSEPAVSIKCGESLQGCLFTTDWKYYAINGSANKRIIVNLTYSGERCNANDLFIFNESCDDIGIVEDTKWAKSWSGYVTSEAKVGLVGDSNNTNCLWTLNVTCATTTTVFATTTTTVSTTSTSTLPTTTTISSSSTTTSTSATTTTTSVCPSSPTQSLSAGDNAIDFQTPHTYYNNIDCYSGVYTCPLGYNANIYAKYDTETYGDFFYIYDYDSAYFVNYTGNSSGFVWLSPSNIDLVRFRFTSDGGVVKWGVDVDKINCYTSGTTTTTSTQPTSTTTTITTSTSTTRVTTTSTTTSTAVSSTSTTTTTPTGLRIAFMPPTEANGTTINRNWAPINVSVASTTDLDTFGITWDARSYSFYNGSLVLALNLNNNPRIGESSTKAIDSSPYGNNGSFTGTVSWTTAGRFNGGLDLKAANAYVRSTIPQAHNQFTVMAWIKLNELNREQHFAEFGNTQFYVRANNKLGTPSWSNTSGKTILSKNVWYHVAMVRNSTAVRLYLNGVDDSDVNGRLGTNPNNYFYVGHSSTLSNGYDFNGTIDEVRVYNVPLTAKDIWLHYQSEFQKYNSTEWRFYVNVTGLTNGSHSYYGSASKGNDSKKTDNGNTRYVRVVI